MDGYKFRELVRNTSDDVLSEYSAVVRNNKRATVVRERREGIDKGYNTNLEELVH